MSRTLGSGLAAHVATTAHTLCAMLRIDLKDGTQLAFTDHDRPLVFDTGDGALTYQPDTGILPSDLSLSAGFDADDMEVSGPIGDVVTRTAVIGGRYDDATVYYFFVNWSDLTQGAAKLVKGYIALATVEGGQFKFTVHSEIGKFARSVGRVITGFCDADLGDARCGFALVPVAATVIGATDVREFSVSYAGAYLADYFNQGTVTFLTGALQGCRPVEIFDWALAYGPDQCSGGTASASSELNGSTTAAEAFNNNTGVGAWTPLTPTNGDGAWLQYTFGGAVNVQKVTIQNADLGDTGPRAVDVQYYNGSIWVTAWSITTGTWGTARETRTFTGATTATSTQWRLLFTDGSSGSFLEIGEVEMCTSIGGVVTLWTDLAEVPAVGDTLELRRGCDKTRATCRDTFDNIVNFRGFPDVPGSDQVLRYPNPGS